MVGWPGLSVVVRDCWNYGYKLDGVECQRSDLYLSVIMVMYARISKHIDRRMA